MTLVVDASVAVKWLVNEEDHHEARDLLDSEHALHAPDIVVVEVANALRKKIAVGHVGTEQVDQGLKDLIHLYDDFTPSASLARRALTIAVQLNHPVYDCLYLADAEGRAVPLVTDDRRLLAKVAQADFAISVLPLKSDRLSTHLDPPR